MNPYNPLPSSNTTSTVLGIWREGDRVVCNNTAHWPARCVKCNAPAMGPEIKLDLVFYPRWTIFMFLFSRLIGIILMLVLRKKATIYLYLCDQHTEARATARKWMWAGIVLGSLMLAGSLIHIISSRPNGVDFMGFGISISVILIAFVWGMRKISPVQLKRIADNQVYVITSPEFRESLPL